MRADRLLSSLLLLQAHGRLTGRALAKRLEVSERTVHRDMEALSAAGVPVFALRGSQGGWQLEEGWRTQVPGLTEAELRALFMAQPQAIGDFRLAAAAESALGKLMAALPTVLRERASSIRQRLHVETGGWRDSGENLSMLLLAQDAVSRDQKLFVRYKKPGRDPVERVVDPLGLVAKSNSWYLVARTPAGIRTFRISRILEARLLDEACERPFNFDLATYWKESEQRFKESWRQYEVRLLAEPRSAKQLKMWHGATEVQRRDGNAEGSVELQLAFNCVEEACSVVMGLGSQVEVMEPTSLRDRVNSEAAAILERMNHLASAHGR